jgi:Ca2+-binding RTX toxin-like protein
VVALSCGAALAAALSAAPAQAQTDSCRASAARAVTAAGTSEPVVANAAGSPCLTDAREAADVTAVGPFTVNEPRANTRRDDGILAASSSVDSAQLTLGAVPVSVGVVSATQVVSCTSGGSTATGSSRVEALVVNGTAVDVIADRPLDQTIGVVRIRANQLDGTTRRALILNAPGTEIVLGEAAASGDACQAFGGGGPGSGQICPGGATYDVARNLCIIREASARGGVIVIGRAYQGPSGGMVISLVEARRRAAAGTLPKSRCLRGSGPKFVVLGSNRADKITGTNRRDRILALAGNDSVDAGRGRDCLDGNRGKDRVAGGLHGDRVYGGSGRDALTGGLGNDRLHSGSGNDSVNTGFGRDYANAGSGNDRVNAASAGRPAKRLLGGKGRDRLWINRNERRRYSGFEIIRRFR